MLDRAKTPSLGGMNGPLQGSEVTHSAQHDGEFCQHWDRNMPRDLPIIGSSRAALFETFLHSKGKTVYTAMFNLPGKEISYFEGALI